MKRRLIVGGLLGGIVLVGLTVVGLNLEGRSATGPTPDAQLSQSVDNVQRGPVDKATETAVSPVEGPQPANAAGNSPASGAGPENAAADGQSGATGEDLVVTTASMRVDVRDVAKAVTLLRTLAQANGTQIADLAYSSGNDLPSPQPQADGALSSSVPANAEVTLRVPVARLADMQGRIGALGTLTGESSSQSNATQQHIDLEARLANLRAEERELRGFLKQAGKVSDLLVVERELSRVQGDIESMQAQLTYLEHQAALATLTVTLSQPGALIRPKAGTWGFASAVTKGVQAAATLAGGLVTGAIALSPLEILAVLGWIGARLLRARRLRRVAA